MVNLTTATRQRLRTLRASREPKLSQYELANRAGLSINRYWRIEKGYAVPTASEATKIARVLKQTTAALFPELPEKG